MNIKMKKILKIMIAIMAISIIFYQVYAGVIRVLGSNNEVIASGEGRLPTGYYCCNHGWPASGYYKRSSAEQSYGNSKRDLIDSYIFSSGASESAKQNAFWQERAGYVGNCAYPDLGSEARELYSQASHYADVMQGGHTLDATDGGDTKRIIKDGKYYYTFSANYDSALRETEVEFSTETKAFYGDFVLDSSTQQTGLSSDKYYYYDYTEDKFKKSTEIYNMQIEFDYPSEANDVRTKNPVSNLYIIDEYGMTHKLDLAEEEGKALNFTEFSRGAEFVAVDAEGNLSCFQKVKLSEYNNPTKYNVDGFDIEALLNENSDRKVYKKIYTIKTGTPLGKNAAKILATYNEETRQAVTSIGLGDPGSNASGNIFYFTSIDLRAVGKDNTSMTKTFSTDSEIRSILATAQSGNKLNFEVEVDENWYDAQSIEITVNYKYMVCKGHYSEYEGCNSEGEFTGSATQVLVHPTAWREWITGDFTVTLGRGNRYVNVEVDKYEGLEANKVTDSNRLKGANFTLRKGYFSGKDDTTSMNSVSYSEANSLFTAEEFKTSKVEEQTRNEWKIVGQDISQFKWEDIKLETADIETRKYVVFELTEEAPEGYVSINKFYLVSRVFDLESNRGFYYLGNTKILCDETEDLNKILLKENGRLQTDSYSVKPVINVTNVKAGEGTLQLLKTDTKGTLLNDIKFDIKVERYKDGVKKGTDDTFTLTTHNSDLSIGDLLGTHGNIDGVDSRDIEFADINSIKFTVKEQDHAQNNKHPDYLSVIPEFTMEFGIKITNNGYVLSNTYVDESKNTFANSFKYNGTRVNFNSFEQSGVSYYKNENGNVSIGIANPNTEDAVINLMLVDETVAFDLEINKKDIGTTNNVKDVGFDIEVTRVDRNNYSDVKGRIYKNSETLYTGEDGKISIRELKNLSLKDVDVNNEYVKVTVTETNPPKVNDNEYYDVVNEGRPFSFIAKVEKDGEKIYLGEIVDTIDWPENTDGVKGYADMPVINENNLSVKLNVRDRYKPINGQYAIRILKTGTNGNLIQSAVYPAEFEIRVNDKDLVNKNPVPGKDSKIFVANGGKIELDFANYSELELKNTTPQKVSIREVKAPDLDGDGNEDFKKINDGEWFTATTNVAAFGGAYRLVGRPEKDLSDWPTATDENKANAYVNTVNNHVVEFSVENDRVINGSFSVTLLKSDEEMTPLQGAEFYTEVKIDGNTVKSGNYTTGSSGAFSISDIPLEHGMREVTIAFRETQAPDINGDGIPDYKLVNGGNTFYTVIPVEDTEEYIRISNNHDDYDFPTRDVRLTVSNNYMVTVDAIDRSLSNPGQYNISLHKVDAEDDNTPVAGAGFTIEVNGEILETDTYVDANGNRHENTFVTNSRGNIETDFINLEDTTPQKVKITETVVPDGYLPINNGNPIEVTLEVVQDAEGTYVLKNNGSKDHVNFPLGYEEDVTSGLYYAKLPETKAPTGEYDIAIHKVDESTRQPVKDAWFKFTVTQGDRVVTLENPNSTLEDKEIFATDDNGNIVTGKIDLRLNDNREIENQYITITEVRAPAGYLPINDGNPIGVTLTVKQEGNKLVLENSSNHTFFPINYHDRVDAEHYVITELPETPTTFELKMYKQFKDNDGTVRKATFSVHDEINGDNIQFNDIDTSGEVSKTIRITSLNSSKIRLKVHETQNELNTEWGTIPDFYLEIQTRATVGGNYVIDTSKEVRMEAVNEEDKPNFNLIKEQLLRVTVASDGTSIAIVATNPLEGQMNIRLNKLDRDANNAAMRDVKFKITINGETMRDSSGNDYLVTNSDGIITIPNRAITNAAGNVVLGIHELSYAEGNAAVQYYQEVPDFIVTLNKTLEDQTYTIRTDYETNLPEGSEVTVAVTGEPRERLVSVSVPNRRRIIRLSGQVWKETPDLGKVSEVSGDKQLSEPFINGITVKVHPTNESNILTIYESIVENTEKKTETQTVNGEVKEGYYFFDVPMYDGAYYIEYIYNGYKYQHTKYTPWNGNGIYSNATETEVDRDELNNKFAIINSGSISNQINQTSETDTSYSGVDIGISAFTGGFGRNNLVIFSAKKYDDTEGKCDNKTGSNNTTKWVDGAIANTTVNGKQYDYVYDNIDLGISPRESVRMMLNKAVNTVKLQLPGKGIEQVYRAKEGLGEDDYEYYVGNMEVGVKAEDVRTTTQGDPNGDVEDVHTYITYRLYLKNNSSEIGVQVNDIVDYFDESLILKQELVKDSNGNIIPSAIRETNKTLKIYTNDNDTGATKTNFKELHISPNVKLNPNVTYYIDVTFEMPTIPDNIIANYDDASEKEAKTKINVAEINSYTTYYIYDGLNTGRSYTYSEHVAGDTAGLFDQTSNPGNVIGLETTGIATKPYNPYPNEPDDGIAFIRFRETEERILSGTVWEDNRTESVEGSIIGNGKYDDGESGYSGVKVQLYDIDTDAVAKVHYIDKKDTAEEWADARIQTTGSDGKYSFTGITPGHYYMIFTYPDGQTYKSTVFGDELNLSDVDNVNSAVFNFADYSDDYSKKSHSRDIYAAEHYTNTDPATKTSTRTRSYINNLLGLDGEINNNSAAEKNIKGSYDEYTSGNSYIIMDAISSRLNVGFETNAASDAPDSDYTGLEYWGGITWEYLREFKVGNINLGVVERPANQLQITKKVDNVKVTLANGSTLFDAVQRATNVQWVGADKFDPKYEGVDEKILTPIDNTLDGNDIPNWRSAVKKGSINLIMDEELMQGATIKIRYKITVNNIGEVDYSDTKFYYTGIEDNIGDNIVKTTVNEVVDYVGYQGTDDNHVTRNNLNYMESDNTGLGWTTKTVAKLREDGKLADSVAGYNVADDNYANTGASAYNTILTNELNASDASLVPTKFEGTGNRSVEKDLTLSRVISSSNSTDDRTYNNMVEIMKLTNDVGRRSRYSTVGNQDPTAEPSEVDTDEAEEVRILPPYGQTQIPYILYAGIALILFVGVSGIVVLRNKTSKE